MPRIDLKLGSVNDHAINLGEEKVVSSRPELDIKQVIAEVRSELSKETIIQAKWAHKDEIFSKIKLLVQKQPLVAAEQDQVAQMLMDDLFGFGILEKYRQDSSVSEIIIDAPDQIMIERGGTLHDVPEKFDSDQELDDWFETHIMAMTDGKRPFNEQNPILDVETRDGERIHANRPPVTEHITLNVRKAAKQTQYFTSKDMIRLKSASPEMMKLLVNAARGRLTILVLGKTGSGKTAFIRLLIEEGIGDDERIIFIEDTRETNARKRRFLSMQTVDSDNKERAIPMTKLFKAGMRMRPERICVSEIRGEEAASFLLTAASGHPGPMTSMHAGNADRAVFLLMVYLKRSGEMDMSEDFLKQFIHEQIHIMVFANRMKNGRRLISEIVEVNPLVEGKPEFTTLFKYNEVTDSFDKLAELSDEKKREILMNGGEAF